MPNKQTTIVIDGLEVHALIGIHAHEATQPQPLRINVRAQYQANGDATPVCYDDMAQNLCRLAQAGHIRLLEDLAEHMAQTLLQDDRIFEVWLRLEKPQALKNLARKYTPAPLVSVEITRYQSATPRT